MVVGMFPCFQSRRLLSAIFVPEQLGDRSGLGMLGVYRKAGFERGSSSRVSNRKHDRVGGCVIRLIDPPWWCHVLTSESSSGNHVL